MGCSGSLLCLAEDRYALFLLPDWRPERRARPERRTRQEPRLPEDDVAPFTIVMIEEVNSTPPKGVAMG